MGILSGLGISGGQLLHYLMVPAIEQLYRNFNFNREKEFQLEILETEREFACAEGEKVRRFTAEENRKHIQAAWKQLHEHYLLRKEEQVFKNYAEKIEKLSALPLLSELDKLTGDEVSLGVFFILSGAGKKDEHGDKWNAVFRNVKNLLFRFCNTYYTEQKLHFSEHLIDLSGKETEDNTEGVRRVLHNVFFGLPSLMFSLDVKHDPLRSTKENRAYILNVAYSVSRFGVSENDENYISNKHIKTEYLISTVVNLAVNDDEKVKEELLDAEKQIAAYLQLTVGCCFDVFNMSFYKEPPLYPGILIEEKRKYEGLQAAGRPDSALCSYPVLSWSSCREELTSFYKRFYTDNLKARLINTDRLDFASVNKILLRYADALAEFLGRAVTDRWRWEVFAGCLEAYQAGAADKKKFVKAFAGQASSLYRLLGGVSLEKEKSLVCADKDKLAFLTDFVWNKVVNRNFGPAEGLSPEIKAELAKLFYYFGCFCMSEYEDERRAAELFSQAAELGSAKAVYNLGCVHLRREPAKALNYFRLAAEKGDAKAADLVAEMERGN